MTCIKQIIATAKNSKNDAIGHTTYMRWKYRPNRCITYLNFKCEIFLEILYDHYKKRKFNSKSFVWICRTGDVCCAYIRSLNFQHQWLDIIICDALDVPISDLNDKEVDELYRSYSTYSRTGIKYKSFDATLKVQECYCLMAKYFPLMVKKVLVAYSSSRQNISFDCTSLCKNWWKFFVQQGIKKYKFR